jgi:hypothetical protein
MDNRRDEDLSKPLTPEQCKALADSFADLPPEFQLTAEDCEMIEEERLNKLLRYGSPEAAVEAMKRRLAVLKAQKAKALNTLDDCDEHLRQTLLRHLRELNSQILATQQRLDGYDFQQRNQN